MELTLAATIHLSLLSNHVGHEGVKAIASGLVHENNRVAELS